MYRMYEGALRVKQSEHYYCFKTSALLGGCFGLSADFSKILNTLTLIHKHKDTKCKGEFFMIFYSANLAFPFGDSASTGDLR